MNSLWLCDRALEVIKKEANNWFPLETGGLLLGYRADNGDVVVKSASVAGPESIHRKKSFTPDELKNDPSKYVVTNEERDWLESLSKELAAGKTIEEAADILFRGLQEDKLYIGIPGFREQHPSLVEAIQNRAIDIINERNPSI